MKIMSYKIMGMIKKMAYEKDEEENKKMMKKIKKMIKDKDQQEINKMIWEI